MRVPSRRENSPYPLSRAETKAPIECAAIVALLQPDCQIADWQGQLWRNDFLAALFSLCLAGLDVKSADMSIFTEERSFTLGPFLRITSREVGRPSY